MGTQGRQRLGAELVSLYCTHIDTARCERIALGDQGDVAEILSRELCGAEAVTGMLRWLHEGNRFDVLSLDNTHQLIYLMEGGGVIELEGESHAVRKGAGIYLGPGETATIRQSGGAPAKLLHLMVPNCTRLDDVI